MVISETALPDVLLIQPAVFVDARGAFAVPYNEEAFRNAGLPTHFVQDNLSVSAKGTVRGLHFQKPPYAQGKLVRVAHGRALDVVVDLREGSETYGKHLAVELTAAKMNMLWIPEGFAHGFAALEDHTVFEYKVTAPYHKASEDCLLWNDPALNIHWGVAQPLLSEKDQLGTPLAQLKSPFAYERI